MVVFSPFVKISILLFSVKLVNFTVPSSTVTWQLAVLFPSLEVAVIIAVPFPTAVTFPSDTLATFSLLDVQYNTLSVTSLGLYTAYNIAFSPVFIDNFVVFKLILSSATVPSSTVTFAVDVFAPSLEVAVIIAVPFPTAVTVPSDTLATLVLLDDHVSTLSPAFVGV